MSHHPPPPPQYKSETVIAPDGLRYARPPYMGQASVGLSGHNQYKAPGLRTAVPPVMVTPVMFGQDENASTDPSGPEPLYDPATYQGPTPAVPTHLISGHSQQHTDYRHNHSDWETFRGPHVIRNNDLQYHYAEPFGFRQVILNSLNATSVADEDNPSADFTVQIGTQMGASLQSISQDFRANAVVLNDITLPQSQYLIEDNWSRLDFSEGINIYTSFRNIHITFPDVYDNGHNIRASGILPLRKNDIKSVKFESSKTFVVEYEEVHSTNINSVQKFWEESLSLQAFSAFQGGHLPLSTKNAKLVHLTDKKIRITLTDKEIDPSTTEICGSMATTNIPSPLHLSDVSNSMLADATHVRHDGSSTVDHTTFDDPAPQYMIPQYTLNFNWNAQIDTYEFTYTVTSDYEGEQPELSGEILEYMGFNSPFKIPPFEDGTSITVQARSQRQKDALSGTRIAPGHYDNADDLALAMENSLNGTWFGGQGISLDNIEQPPFHIYFIDQSINQRVVCVPSGRYTPCELAKQINNSFITGFVKPDGLDECVVGASLPISIEAVPVFDDSGIQYLGMKFISLEETSGGVPLPFSIDFKVTAAQDPQSIDPRRLGYDFEFYRGQTTYNPKDELPYYPVIVQGGQQRIFRSLQQYEVRANPLTQKMSIITRPFLYVTATSGSYLGNRRGILELPIAHGLPPGTHVFLAFDHGAPGLSYMVSATVLEQDSLICTGSDDSVCCTDVPPSLRGNNDPTFMIVCFGGLLEDPFAGVVVGGDGIRVEFTSQNIWTLNTHYGVENCIRREALGFSNKFYGFVNKGSAFRVPTNTLGIEFLTNTTFIFPNSYQLDPYKYVLVKVIVGTDEQGDGSTSAILTAFDGGTLVSRGANNFIARIPIGKDVDTAHWNLDSKVFNIQHIAINRLNKVRIQIFNPDGTLYNFHGLPTSVGLAFNIVRGGAP